MSLAVLAVLILWLLTGTDEDRIRGLIDDIERDFNRTRATALIQSFSSEYKDETVGIDRAELLNTFRASFFRHRDQGAYQFEVELLSDAEIAVDDDRATARGELLLRDAQSRGSVMWRVDLTLDFIREGSSWRVHRSRWKTLEGRRPF